MSIYFALFILIIAAAIAVSYFYKSNIINGGSVNSQSNIKDIWRAGSPHDCGRLIELLKKFVKNPTNFLYRDDAAFLKRNIKGGCKCGGARADYHAAAIYKTVSDVKVKNYLDVGCSDGSITVALSKMLNVTADAVDVHANAPVGVRYKKITDVLPYEDNSFDLITCNMVLHHIENVDDMIKEITRVLRPGGTFYLKEHDCWDDTDKRLILLEHQAYEHTGEMGDFAIYHYLRCKDWILKTPLTVHSEGVFHTGEKECYTATRARWIRLEKPNAT